METVNTNEETLTPDQQQEIVKNELAIIPAADKQEIEKVVKSTDLILIGTHKKKVTSFRRRFQAKDFLITPDLKFDKAVYDKAMEKWREVKNYRTKIVEPDFKKLKEPYNKLLKYYNEAGNPIIADLKDIEKPISDYIDKMEELKKEEEEKEKRELEKRSSERRQKIMDAGAAFDGSYYSIGSEEFGVATISLGESDINSLTDDLFNKILEDIVAKNEIIVSKTNEKIAAEQEQERLRLEKIEKDKEEIRIQQERLKEQNKKIRSRELKSLGFVADDVAQVYFSDPVTITFKQVEELSLDEWDVLISESEKRIEDKKANDTRELLIGNRKLQLLSIGMNEYLGVFTSKYKEDVYTISLNSMGDLNDSDWELKLQEAKNKINEHKKQEDEDNNESLRIHDLSLKREKVLAPYWKFVTISEKNNLGTITDEAFTSLYELKKKSHEDEQVKLNEERIQREQAQLAMQGDEAMFADYIEKLFDVHVPDVKTPEFKTKVDKIISLLKSF